MKPLLAIFSLLLGACAISAPEQPQDTVAREVTIPVSVEVATPANAPLTIGDSPLHVEMQSPASATKASFAASGCASGQCPMMRSTPNAVAPAASCCASSGVAAYERPRLFRGRLLARWRR